MEQLINNLFLPEEFLVLGAFIQKRSTNNKVSQEDVHNFIKRCKFNIEYSDEPFKYIKFDDKNNEWIILRMPDIHPYILNILTSI